MFQIFFSARLACRTGASLPAATLLAHGDYRALHHSDHTFNISASAEEAAFPSKHGENRIRMIIEIPDSGDRLFDEPSTE
jgi:hypothetical protein